MEEPYPLRQSPLQHCENTGEAKNRKSKHSKPVLAFSLELLQLIANTKQIGFIVNKTFSL